MKTRAIIAISTGVLFIALTSYEPESCAEVNVSIGVGVPVPQVVIPAPPPVVIPEPPAVVVVPGTYVYFAPDVGVDIFFYQGYWYRPHHGHWYRAKGYEGPWHNIKSGKVPHVVRDLPPDFRHAVRHHDRIRHVDLEKNWKTWEQNKRWEKHDYGREARGDRDGGRWENTQSKHEGRGKHNR